MRLPIYSSAFALLGTSFLAEQAAAANMCACDALKYDFNIDCSNQDAMLEAMKALEVNDCAVECNSKEVCRKNYLIILSHHDYCLHEEVPETLETGIHVYEDVCTDVHCDIIGKFDAESRLCPPVDCESDVGNQAYEAISTLDCESDCSNSECANNFRIIKAVHDGCPKDALGMVVEIHYHDIDEACDAFGCNVAGADRTQNQLICPDPFKAITSGGSSLKALPFAMSLAAAAAVNAIM